MDAPGEKRWLSYLVVALVSMSLLGCEIIWTRIFSAEFFYTFAFLILSLAVMGLGMGAMCLRFFPALGGDRALAVILALVGAATIAGPPLVFLLDLEFAALINEWAMVGKLIAAIGILSSGFFLSGIALAALFKRAHGDMARLYMADLLGAALGVLVAIAAMNWLSTPTASFVIALPVVAAAALWARRWLRLVALPPLVAVAILAVYGDGLLAAERKEPAPVVYTHWDATSKVKIYDFGADARGLNIDNAANSPVYAFDGDWAARAADPYEFGIDVKNLIDRNPDCTFLSLGAGGGVDALQALQAGAAEVHAVEVNPHINDLMRGRLAEFNGHIYSDPRVIVATEDARAYVRRHRYTFDMIYSLSSNSFAALSSGSFALAENYLFTTEAFADYWRALTDNGFMMMEHQFYMPRLVAALIEALRAAGVANPEDHLAVYELPRMRRHMLLLGKQPLTDEIRANAFGHPAADAANIFEAVYPATPGSDNLIAKIVTQGWESVAADAPIDISPATDDRPFVGQLGLWRNFDWEKPDKLFWLEIYGFPLATIILLLIISVVVILVLPVTLLPYLRRSQARLGGFAYLYFFTIGVAFMAVEIVLLQRYALFVGATVYGSTAILTALLAGAGLGSRLTPRLDARIAFAGLAAWLVCEALLFPSLLELLVALPMAARIAVAVVLVAPLGALMGMPFPRGARRVGELIDWGFAVNGVASVIGATGVLLLAMSQGFRVALLVAALLYGGAFLLLSRSSGWGGAAGGEDSR